MWRTIACSRDDACHFARQVGAIYSQLALQLSNKVTSKIRPSEEGRRATPATRNPCSPTPHARRIAKTAGSVDHESCYGYFVEHVTRCRYADCRLPPLPLCWLSRAELCETALDVCRDFATGRPIEASSSLAVAQSLMCLTPLIFTGRRGVTPPSSLRHCSQTN